MKLAPLVVLAALLALAAPAQPAPAPTCDAECSIDSNAFGYQLPVTLVASGAAVTWRSLDTVHVTLDGAGFGEDRSCFTVVHNRVEPSPAVRFDVAGGVLTATTLSEAGTSTEECVNASPLPDGAFVLPYFCSLHPSMRGVLVVRG